MSDSVREVGRFRNPDIISDDHGGLAMGGSFDYGSTGQGFGYRIDITFVQRFMEVFGVERLRDVNDKACWVTHTHDNITKLEPLLPRDGKVFDIEAWSLALRKGRAP